MWQFIGVDLLGEGGGGVLQTKFYSVSLYSI